MLWWFATMAEKDTLQRFDPGATAAGAPAIVLKRMNESSSSAVCSLLAIIRYCELDVRPIWPRAARIQIDDPAVRLIRRDAKVVQ